MTSEKVNVAAKIALYGVGLIALILLLRKIGIFADTKEKTISKFEKSGNKNPLNYKLFKRPEKKDGYREATLKAKDVKNVSFQMKELFDKFNVNENSVISVFKKMTTLSDVYFVNGYMVEKYTFDLWDKLRGALNDEELFEVVKYIVKLPSYEKIS